MKLAAIFSDGAVLQREKLIPVWGTTESGVLVHAELAGKTAYTRAADDGRFMLRLPAMTAGGPFELKVEADNGETAVVRDVLIGEVWLAGGQSNMEYPLHCEWIYGNKHQEEKDRRMRADQEKDFMETTANLSNFRYISIPRIVTGARNTSFKAAWLPLDRKNAGECSAVGAWFGKYLRENLNVPVGIICDNWGGTIAEAWTSRSGLLRNPVTAEILAGTDAAKTVKKYWLPVPPALTPPEMFETMSQKDPGNKGFGMGWAKPEFDDSAWKGMMIPGDWIAQKIGGNGACWFRKIVYIPERWAGKTLLFRTGGIDKHDTCYFNGAEIGRTGKDFEEEYWNQPRCYEVKPELVKAGFAVVAIRAYSFFFGGGFVGHDTDYVLQLKGTDETISLSGEWRAKPEFDMGIKTNPLDAIAAANANMTSSLFDGLIRPVLPYAMRGVIWYQGESNAFSLRAAEEYYVKLKIMIEDWRYHFEQGDFPFIQVQLANFRSFNADADAPKPYGPMAPWTLLREAQLKLTRDMKNVFMISAIDVGNLFDIHPQDKKTVGRRLADNALYNVYHRHDFVPNGPHFRSAKVEGSAIRITFDQADGMYFAGGEPKGFFVAGARMDYLSDTVPEFVPADKVVIEGNELLVSAESVKTPTAVRYGWTDYTDGNLYNAGNHPASPFRTDTWEIR